tara:strand:+ start:237 stop:428 length:192 start_codon:yes stop_codon:yes gene_type:complete
MHIERRKNKLKVGNDHFFSQCWNPNVGVNVGVGVGVGKNVGVPVDQTPIRLNFEVMLKVINID